MKLQSESAIMNNRFNINNPIN